MGLALLIGFLSAKSTFRLNFGGDIMLYAMKPNEQALGDVAPYLQSGISFANLEVPLTNSKLATKRKSSADLRSRRQFVLKASPAHANYLAQAGISAVSLGNNHCMDFGSSGLFEMTSALKSSRIAYSGAGLNLLASRAMAVRLTHSGRRVGLLSALCFLTHRALETCTPATEVSAGVNVLDLDGRLDKPTTNALKKWIGAAKRQCDYLVMGVHWGTERESVPNPYQVRLGRTLVDCGVDVVWGNHPHVLQGAELYKRRPIFYSMGNLISPLSAQTGIIRMINSGKRRSFQFIPAVNRHGRCVVVKGPGSRAALRNFDSLCEAIQRKYPNPYSRALPLLSYRR
jgi:poly-gamma-glutamate capsule biosynthesis protein CapA/YwtB (metallophosphatase superfamily)